MGLSVHGGHRHWIALGSEIGSCELLNVGAEN